MPKPAPIDTAAIERANAFTATIFLGTGRYRREPFTDLEEARAAARRFTSEVNNGRLGMVYASTPDGRSIFVPNDYQPKERTQQMTTETNPLPTIRTSTEISQLTAMITGGGFKRANSRDSALKRFETVAAERGVDTTRILGAASFEQAKTVLAHSLKTTPAKDSDTPLPALTAEDHAAIDGAAKKIGAEIMKRRANRNAIAAVKGEPAEKPASKPAKAPSAPKGDHAAGGKRAAILEAAQRGEMPQPPDFSANTHKPHRKRLEAVIALAEKGDIEGLRAFPINPISSSPKAIAKYRDLAVIALEARAAKKEAA